MTVNDRALAYLQKVYKGRNIRIDPQGEFEMESGADFHGNTFWSRIAYVTSPNSMTAHQTLLIDVTGDSDRVMLTM
jgi:hypothetical protein